MEGVLGEEGLGVMEEEVVGVEEEDVLKGGEEHGEDFELEFRDCAGALAEDVVEVDAAGVEGGEERVAEVGAVLVMGLEEQLYGELAACAAEHTEGDDEDGEVVTACC